MDNYRNKEASQQALNESARQYVMKCVGDIVPRLIPKFIEYIQESLPDLPKTRLLDEKKIRIILNSFCWLYPMLSYNFEKSRGKPYVYDKVIYDTNESSIEHYKQVKLTWHKELKAQEECKHKFGDAKYSALIKSSTKKCSKCGQVKRVLR